MQRVIMLFCLVSLPPSALTAEDVNAWYFGSMGDFPRHSTLAGCWGRFSGWWGFLFFSCVSYGPGRGLFWRKLFHGIVDQVAKFQCRLFLLVQALIFGDRVDSLGLLCDLCELYRVVLAGFLLVGLGPIIVGKGMSDGRSVWIWASFQAKGDCHGGLS